MIPFVQSKDGYTVYINTEAKILSKDHPKFEALSSGLLRGDMNEDTFLKLYDTAAEMVNFSAGHLAIKDDELFYDGVSLHNALVTRIIDLLKKKKSAVSLIRFMDYLMENPSYRATQALYDFLDACDLPITEDGCFLAYKKVDQNYLSIHANPDGTKMDNHIGKILTMPRNQVDEDPERTCSTGLHVCSFGYLSEYSSTGSDRILIVKVNPRDVVAVPKDYNNQKMRVCRYQVVGEIPNDHQTKIKDTYSTDDYRGEAWKCTDANAGWNNPYFKDYRTYYDMTANMAKAAYSREQGIPYTRVRVRKA